MDGSIIAAIIVTAGRCQLQQPIQLAKICNFASQEQRRGMRNRYPETVLLHRSLCFEDPRKQVNAILRPADVLKQLMLLFWNVPA
jgi:hypothetical protein